MAGKGDKRRPCSVPQEVFVDNWEKIFGKVPTVKRLNNNYELYPPTICFTDVDDNPQEVQAKTGTGS